MTEKEVLLTQLEEYGIALERLQRDEHQGKRATPGAFTHQLFHLERKILQLQTQLSVLDLKVRRPPGRDPSASVQESLWAYLNPWHPEFHMGAYVAILAVLMLAVSILPIVWGQ